MVNEYPLVSIIVATFERGHLIGETLSSIQDQTYNNWECIIVDDGSTDNTKKVLTPFLENDERFTYSLRSDSYKKGLPGARNMGLDLAKGDLIIFFDDDDIIHPKNLEINVHQMISSGKSFCRFDKEPFFGEWQTKSFPPVEEQDLEGLVINKDKVGKVLQGEIPFASCTVMWDKKCFLDNRFNEELLYAEEWELYSRILINGFEGISIDQVLYYNRKHSDSNTGEFYNNDPIRRDSKIKAIKIVIENLKKAGLLSKSLELFFLRLGFSLRAPSVLDFTLQKSEAGWVRRIKYKMGYKFYFLLRPFFIFKSKMLRQ